MLSFFTAGRIFDGHQFLPDNTAIGIDDAGVVKGIVSCDEVNPAELQRWDGTITPGFVNVHCHLELSHMKGVIPEKTGLVDFLLCVMKDRNATEKEKDEARNAALKQIWDNGIVAIGDIANTPDTLSARMDYDFHFHTFVESLGTIAVNAADRFASSERIYKAFSNQRGNARILNQSIAPHAPYSVSDTLMKMISDFDPLAVLSIHNEETQAEIEYFRTKTGEMNKLYEGLNIDHSSFTPTGKTSLQSYFPLLGEHHRVILVHNTFVTDNDLDFIRRQKQEVFFCLCPNANLYIEGRMPPVNKLIEAGVHICVGTDSLASNHRLDIFSEIKIIKDHFPEISWETLLHWATSAGAKALNMLTAVGAIELGKRPGFCLIDPHWNEAKRLTFNR